MTDTDIRRVEDISIALIDPDADNLRRHVNGTDDLVASIRAHGIISPLIVFPDGDGRFGLVAGHRRFAAATAAELTTVPAIIDPALIDPQLRLEVQLIENLQREDLDPVEEATGYFRLVNECGAKVKAIAERVGRSTNHVSKRLSLLELPPTVLAKVKKGEATVDQALVLRKLGERENIEKVAKESFPNQWERAVDNLADNLERAELVRAEADKLRSKGVTVIDSFDQDTMRLITGHYQTITFNVGGDEVGDQAAVKAHSKEPCHAARVHASGYGKVKPEVSWLCTDPKRHTKTGDSPLKTARSATPDRVKRERQMAALTRQVEANVKAKVLALGTGRLDAERTKLTSRVIAEVVIAETIPFSRREVDAQPITEALGLESVISVRKDYNGEEKNVVDWWTPLRTFADASPANLQAVARVCALHLGFTGYGHQQMRELLLDTVGPDTSEAAVQLAELQKG